MPAGAALCWCKCVEQLQLQCLHKSPASHPLNNTHTHLDVFDCLSVCPLAGPLCCGDVGAALAPVNQSNTRHWQAHNLCLYSTAAHMMTVRCDSYWIACEHFPAAVSMLPDARHTQPFCPPCISTSYLGACCCLIHGYALLCHCCQLCAICRRHSRLGGYAASCVQICGQTASNSCESGRQLLITAAAAACGGGAHMAAHNTAFRHHRRSNFL